MYYLLIILNFFILFGGLTFTTQAQKLGKSDCSELNFSRFLLENQEYELSIHFLNDYERTDRCEEDYFYQLGYSFYKSGEFDKSSKVFSTAFKVMDKAAYSDTLKYKYGLIAVGGNLRANNPHPFKLKNRTLSFNELKSSSQKETYSKLEMLSILKKDDLSRFDAKYENYSGLLDTNYEKLHDLYTRMDEEYYKKKILPTIFSAIVPGSGKLYLGNKYDALNSFLMNAGFGYLAYRGFKKHGLKSFSGWFFGSIGFSFYAGNIYGTYMLADMMNERTYETYQNEINYHINVTIGFN